MKTLVLMKMLSVFFLASGWITLYGQRNQPEVPGNNFSLEGALELFKKSVSPEEFEQLLNAEESKVNNLDLNGDGYIDYIRVIDRADGNVHAFILQAVISESESQDIAVIELEKLANGEAVLQITGDADVYGIETIIEPTSEVRMNAGFSTMRTVVNVWAWPSVQYIYSPFYYSAWVSPWQWSVQPIWWRPWRPVDYYVYDPWWQPYRPYYSSCNTHRVVYAHHLYQPYRTTSVVVYTRHHSQIEHYRSNNGNRNGDGRDRNDSNHSTGRQGRTLYHDDSNGRTPSLTYNTNERSRTIENSRGHSQPGDYKVRESSTNRSNYAHTNKSQLDIHAVPNRQQRYSSEQSHPDFSNRRPGVSDFNTNTQRQNMITPSRDTRVNQQSHSPQTNTNRSLGGNTLHRSGEVGGNPGNRSGGHSKGYGTPSRGKH